MTKTLSVMSALAMTLTLLVAAPATAQSTPTLTVTPDSIERPDAGNKPATLNFTVTGCDDCTVELDPGWLLPAANQAVKGKNDDFGAANYWNTGVIYGNKRGKGPVPETLGIKVRPGDGTRKFIRFTLNDSNSFVVAEAKVWLTPRPAPQQPEPQQSNQEPQQQQPQQPQQDEYLLQRGPNDEEIECYLNMTNGTTISGFYHRQERYPRGYYDRGLREWIIEYIYTTPRPLRPGEYFRLEYGTYRNAPNGNSDFDFRWRLVSVVDANTGEEMDNFGLPTNTDEPGGGFNAPDKSFTINYAIEALPFQAGSSAANTCSATFAVR